MKSKIFYLLFSFILYTSCNTHPQDLIKLSYNYPKEGDSNDIKVTIENLSKDSLYFMLMVDMFVDTGKILGSALILPRHSPFASIGAGQSRFQFISKDTIKSYYSHLPIEEFRFTVFYHFKNWPEKNGNHKVFTGLINPN